MSVFTGTLFLVPLRPISPMWQGGRWTLRCSTERVASLIFLCERLGHSILIIGTEGSRETVMRESAKIACLILYYPVSWHCKRISETFFFFFFCLKKKENGQVYQRLLWGYGMVDEMKGTLESALRMPVTLDVRDQRQKETGLSHQRAD